MFAFDRKYFLLALVLFIMEVLIALYVRDAFVRPYVGDFLVVILIYCAVRAFFILTPWKLALGVLLFSFLVEALQYFRLVDRLGLQDHTVARTVIGYGFEWMDMLAYTMGIACVLAMEHAGRRQPS